MKSYITYLSDTKSDANTTGNSSINNQFPAPKTTGPLPAQPSQLPTEPAPTLLLPTCPHTAAVHIDPTEESFPQRSCILILGARRRLQLSCASCGTREMGQWHIPDYFSQGLGAAGHSPGSPRVEQAEATPSTHLVEANHSLPQQPLTWGSEPPPNSLSCANPHPTSQNGLDWHFKAYLGPPTLP